MEEGSIVESVVGGPKMVVTIKYSESLFACAWVFEGERKQGVFQKCELKIYNDKQERKTNGRL